jgi:hypothetical protein
VPDPDPPPDPNSEDPEDRAHRVVATFADSPVGNRLTLSVLEQRPNRRCRANAFVPIGDVSGHVGVYLSDCRDWEKGGLGLYFFFVHIQNMEDRVVSVRRVNFTAVDRRDRRHRPVGIRGRAMDAEPFLAARTRIRAGSSVRGFLAFDAGRGYVPIQLRYLDRAERLVVRFEGGRKILPRE